VAASHKIVIGFVVLFVLGVPLDWIFSWSTMVAYWSGLLAMTPYFLCLLIILEWPRK
jgi:hypothetical protein